MFSFYIKQSLTCGNRISNLFLQHKSLFVTKAVFHGDSLKFSRGKYEDGGEFIAKDKRIFFHEIYNWINAKFNTFIREHPAALKDYTGRQNDEKEKERTPDSDLCRN